MNDCRGFRFLEHTTDAEIEAYGKNIEEAFENAGRAVEETMVELKSIRPIETREIHIEGKDLESLLYSWVEALISLQDTEGLLFSRFECKIYKNKNSSNYKLTAKIAGERYDPSSHEQKTAIKAPTYHDMKISTDHNQKVTMRFLVDL